MSKSPDANLPVEQLRHRKIKAAVWKNSSATGPFYTVTISRSFKKDEIWHDTQSFRYDDLPIVAKLLNDAHSVISRLIASGKAAANKPPPRRKS
jgi:hypothetical protein